ncbi:hypothetical protein EXU57_24600 [Segetibacter sp. 3557_3]|uniref:IS66 family insertion sequence element accessory protein TnpA n=1 Tax=Segetibacter sp. 3557_3 TaxID=2547429 RepID=UPI001058E116|nr:hypothetical protein [Segetibacter sp. 3557_3]TDH18056.1 hypothetical protein EXU57_24600 [Segetibacter sp. 3557_3]
MEQSIMKRRVKRRTVGEIKLLLEAFATSGLSIQSFCDQHIIGKSTFHKWQSRYSNKQDQSISKAFAHREIVTTCVQHSATLFAEVKGIKVYQAVTAAYLRELLL